MKEVLELGGSGVGSDVVIKGWVRTMRSALKGKLLFLAINDGSCQDSLQVPLNHFLLLIEYESNENPNTAVCAVDIHTSPLLLLLCR